MLEGVAKSKDSSVGKKCRELRWPLPESDLIRRGMAWAKFFASSARGRQRTGIEVISNACMLRFNAKGRLDCGTPRLDVCVRQNNSLFLIALARG